MFQHTAVGLKIHSGLQPYNKMFMPQSNELNQVAFLGLSAMHFPGQ
jgi:hypothetical protein